MIIGSYAEALFRLFLAFLSGAVIGYERSYKRVDAGFRTHIIVCMASCAIMITNIHTFLLYNTGDPVRMPAQVISGVGFLGAGCILVTRDRRIKGITTAAGIWAAACLGLCIGAGDYVVALAVLVMAVLTLTVFRSIDATISKRTRYLRLYLEFETVSDVKCFVRYMRESENEIHDMDFMTQKVLDSVGVIAMIKLKNRNTAERVISEIEKEDWVVYVSKL